MKGKSRYRGILLGMIVLAAPTPSHAKGMLDAASIPQFVEPLFIPPAMPLTAEIRQGAQKIDYYEIAARQFDQQILPTTGFGPRGKSAFPKTTMWGYGSVQDRNSFHYPAATIEATVGKPVRVKWINDLKDTYGRFLSHLLAVDQTLNWANPPRLDCRDSRNTAECQAPYAGPVPLVTHLHGAHVGEESDGFPLSWYLPAAKNIPEGYDAKGKDFGQIPGVPVQAGAAVFQYPNDQRATSLWYHDHAMGITRLNVYAGLAGFYLLRGGEAELRSGSLPGPAPARGDACDKKYYEIPVVIQDKSFNDDGSLFYPSNRALFENLQVSQLDIPFIPEQAYGGMSDISPIWNPEFFGNTIVVNGKTWPFHNVEPRKYRLRLLNATDSRFLILASSTVKGSSRLKFWQIGSDGGFLPAPVELTQILLGPAERADVVVDFSAFKPDDRINIVNYGPDEPYGGGIPYYGCMTDVNAPAGCFEPSNPQTTGKVMQFRVVPRVSVDTSTNPRQLALPPLGSLGPATNTRKVSLNEAESSTVLVTVGTDGSIVFNPTAEGAVPLAPAMAMLGTVNPTTGLGNPLMFADPVTENPELGSTEIWEIHNFTEDAHPVHVHQVQFRIVNRQAGNVVRPPEPGERGYKDTVITYPGEITRIKARFDLPGMFLWHCHILSHEDNEMMRPLYVGTMPAGR